MNSYITVADNSLGATAQRIRDACHGLLDDAGTVFWDVARNECPISTIDEPGYVHLVETINYDIADETTFYQTWVTFYAVKHYAQYVNNGTSRMPARPFFDKGLAAVGDQIDGLILKRFHDLMNGGPPGPPPMPSLPRMAGAGALSGTGVPAGVP